VRDAPEDEHGRSADRNAGYHDGHRLRRYQPNDVVPTAQLRLSPSVGPLDFFGSRPRRSPVRKDQQERNDPSLSELVAEMALDEVGCSSV
jgi:hypothetical protein